MKNHQENSKATQTGLERTEADLRRSVLKRRLVMRGAAAAVPAILTLRSGAALARSSNLISTATDLPESTLAGTDGDVYYCLDQSSVEQVGANVYDLGEPPEANVTAIRADRSYFDAPGGNRVTPSQMCQNGGTYYTEGEGGSVEGKAPAQPDFLRQSFIPTQTGGEPVNVAQGGLVSATAFTSILSRANINIREI